MSESLKLKRLHIHTGKLVEKYESALTRIAVLDAEKARLQAELKELKGEQDDK